MKKLQPIKTIAHDAAEHLGKLRRILESEKELLLEFESEIVQVERNQQDPNIREHHLDAERTRTYIRILEKRLHELEEQ
ncbi:MAG: hypothetical protein NTV82_02805 [Candidatus Aminicenantes bacterium]|nr:hypothetical protein [Candidatus Aminicenantes bacterium]